MAQHQGCPGGAASFARPPLGVAPHLQCHRCRVGEASGAQRAFLHAGLGRGRGGRVVAASLVAGWPELRRIEFFEGSADVPIMAAAGLLQAAAGTAVAPAAQLAAVDTTRLTVSGGGAAVAEEAAEVVATAAAAAAASMGGYFWHSRCWRCSERLPLCGRAFCCGVHPAMPWLDQSRGRIVGLARPAGRQAAHPGPPRRRSRSAGGHRAGSSSVYRLSGCAIDTHPWGFCTALGSNLVGCI